MVSYSNAIQFGEGNGAILLDSLGCVGTEKYLLNCTHDGIGNSHPSCGHDNDVGVQCPVGKREVTLITSRLTQMGVVQKI